MKSQLELYLEGLDSPICEIVESEVKTTKSINERDKTTVLKCLDICQRDMTTGWIKDFHFTMNHSNFRFCQPCMPNLSISGKDVIRWFIMITLMCLAIRDRFYGVFLDRSVQYRFMPTLISICGWILTTTFTSSVVVAILLNAALGSAYSLFRGCQLQFHALLGVIKRLQIVSLGCSISHPLPPVGKLENSLVDQYGRLVNDRSFVCREMRQNLALAVTELLLGLQELMKQDSNCEDPELHDLLHLMRTVTEMSAISSRLPTSDYLQELSTLAFDKCRTGIVRTIYKRLYSIHSNNIMEALTVLVTTPLLIANVTLLVRKCLVKIRIVSNGLQVSSSTSQELSEPDTSQHCKAYLNLRCEISKLRSKFDEASHKLWLCELSLNATEVTQLLLNDKHKATNNPEKLLAVLSHSLSRLHGVNSTVVSDYRDSSGMELFGASLPRLDDLQCIDRQLKELISLVRGDPSTSTNSSKIVMSIEKTTDSTEAPKTGGPFELDFVQQTEFGALSTDIEKDHRIDPLSREARDKNKDQPHVVEVYATVIPTQVTHNRKRTDEETQVAREDQLRAERERLQARSLMKELNSHLTRLEGVTVKVERVRTMVSNVEGSEGGVEVSINTSTHVVDPSVCPSEEPATLLGGNDAERDVVALQPSGVAHPNLKSLLAASSIRVKQEELCYGTSSDED